MPFLVTEFYNFSSVCAHMVKYKEIRVDGRTKSYEKSGLLRSFFTYTILCKGERPAGYSLARLLKANFSHLIN
jgi:hypothetical protein